MDAKQLILQEQKYRVLVSYETGRPLYVKDFGESFVDLTTSRERAFKFCDVSVDPSVLIHVLNVANQHDFGFSGLLLEEPTPNP